MSIDDIAFLIDYLRECLRLDRWGSGRELLRLMRMMTPMMMLMLLYEFLLRGMLSTEGASHCQLGGK